MSELPAPLTPAGCDLRFYDWFPFFHKRLRQSSFWKRASDLACRISVDLWSEAYEQVPAASVPNDDYLLAEWAGFGRRDISGWLAVKDEVMSAWVHCSDGRWYHPTLSEVAREAFVKQRMHAWSKECDRLRKENARRAKAGEPLLELPAKPSENPFVEAGSDGTLPISEGRPTESPPVPAENALRRTRTETYRRSSSLRSEDPSTDDQARERSSRPKPEKPPRKHPYPPDAFDRWYQIYPHKVGKAAAQRAFVKVQGSDGVPFDALESGLERYKRTKPPDRAWCNPATWLNEGRWGDEPAASPTSHSLANSCERSIDLGGGNSAKPSVIGDLWGRGRWLSDWGPSPSEPGCRISPEDMAQIMKERQAA